MLIFAALAMPVVIGVAALVAEFGNALLNRVEQQRVADISAYAGALAYGKAQSTADMNAAALRMAALNGVPASDIAVALVASPKSADRQAVNVTVTSFNPLLLARVISSRPELEVSARSFAEIGEVAVEHTPGCMLALDAAQSGITLSGGTRIEAPSCMVSSNAAVSVPCGTRITTLGLNYNSAAAPSQPCNGIFGPDNAPAPLFKTATPDPLAGNAAVAALAARIQTVNGMNAPFGPTVPAGGNIDFAYNEGATKSQATAVGCTATKSGNVWTLNCPGKSVINFGTITVGGGITLSFNPSAPASTVYNFSGAINSTAAAMTFGPGIYNIAGGIVSSGNAVTGFGAGTFRIGMSAAACGSARYSICTQGSSTLTFAGPSTFELAGGINSDSSNMLTLGSGTTNSYRIGPGSTGHALVMSGSSKVRFADALGPSNVFQVKGNINAANAGGSCLYMGAAAQHDIDGYFSSAGGVSLGAGIYTVNGYFALGASNGGGVWCDGASLSLRANDVSLVLSGSPAISGGTCNGQAFCVSSGYSNVVLRAPETGANAKLAVIGPVAGNSTAGAAFTQGGSNGQISGAFYFPKGPIELSGGAGVSGGGGGCLQMIGSRITLSGGTSTVSECIAAAAGGGGEASASSRVSIVQ